MKSRPGESEYVSTVRNRVHDHAFLHWSEFAVIIVSANIVSALVLFGRLLAVHLPGNIRALVALIAVSSTIAAALAYYSVLVGSTVALGPLRLIEVTTSLAIAAAQLGMFLWPIHVLSAEELKTSNAYLEKLNNWLLFFALFAFAAAPTSLIEARSRRAICLTDGSELDDLEKSQASDRLFATLTGLVAITAWALSLVWLSYAVIVSAVLVAATAMSFGLCNQEQAAKRLAELAKVDIRRENHS